jgi:hypothetical protein
MDDSTRAFGQLLADRSVGKSVRCENIGSLPKKRAADIAQICKNGGLCPREYVASRCGDATSGIRVWKASTADGALRVASCGCPCGAELTYEVAARRAVRTCSWVLKPVGGKGVERHDSVAQYVARELSHRLALGRMPGIEGALFSDEDLTELEFTGGVTSSATGFYPLSAFRLTD